MKIEDNKFTGDWPGLRRKRRKARGPLVRHTFGFVAHALFHGLPRPFAPHEIPRTFFGINCAPNPDPSWDETHLNWLRELGVGCVRVDMATWDVDPEPFRRWVSALHTAGFEVIAHIVQRAGEAAQSEDFTSSDAMRTAIESQLRPVREMVSHVEIGSTPNRHTWSGYTVSDYVRAHECARPMLGEMGLRCLGPNVQDFAPYFNVALLGELRRRGLTPQVHTDNLFVDRAGVPPERFDHRAVSRLLSPLFRLTLLRKLRWLAGISQWAGCEETWITCFAWTVARSERAKVRHVEPALQAAYLMRYFLLAAASGLVSRVFWDQLTGHLRGLIDDGNHVRYNPPEVFLRRANHACPGDQAKRPAFHALAEVTRHIAGARFLEARVDAKRVHLTFGRGGKRIECDWKIDDTRDPAPQFTTSP